jgi:acyl carrier protein phosphodiesterase
VSDHGLALKLFVSSYFAFAGVPTLDRTQRLWYGADTRAIVSLSTMNYLAHLYLAEDSPEVLLGNFLGDFVTGQDLQHFSAGIQWGIRCHQKIDAFTDTHPIFRVSKHRIPLERRRFAGIMIDIFYDHFLARDWEQYGKQSLSQFSLAVYQLLEQYHTILPTPLQRALPYLIHQDWLNTYCTVEGIELTLLRVSKRIKRSNPLAQGILDFEANYQLFEQDFQYFWPDLVRFSQTLRRDALG